eukprot:EG_transcript_22965
MGFSYACVVRVADCVLLTATPLNQEVFGDMITKLVAKIKPKVMRMSYIYDNNYFHYILEQGLIFMLVADNDTSRRAAFEFLEVVKQTFLSMYTEPVGSLTPSTCTDFSAVWKEKFEATYDGDKLVAVRQELKKVQTIMVENVERLVERGERIETIVERTEELEAASEGFRRSAGALRRQSWWQAKKMILALVAVLLAVVCGLWLLLR